MSYSSEVLADSPLGYWRLGETSGTTAADSSGNSRAGTYNGSLTRGVTGLLTGDPDTAVSGWSDPNNVQVAHDSWMNVSAFTVEAWVRPTAHDTFNFIATRDFQGSAGEGPWWVGLNAGKVTFVVTSPGVTNFVGTATVPLNQNSHIVCSYDGATMRIYVNGVLDASTAKTGTPSVTTEPLRIGRWGTAALPFVGTLDEVAFYGAALSDSRVAAHYAAGTTGSAAVDLSLAGTAPAPVAAFALDVAALDVGLTLAGTAPAPVAAFALDVTALPSEPADLSLTGVAPAPVASFVLGLDDFIVEPAPVEVDSEIVDTVDVDPVEHEAEWHPDVPAVLPPAAGGFQLDVLRVHSEADMVGTQPVYTTTTVQRTRHVDRILVRADGEWTDISYFRGVHTPTPDFQLIEPLTYGAGSLTLPQVCPVFENLNAIPWLSKGAIVIVQRVDPDTENVTTDYRGRIKDWNVSGASLTVELGGMVSGPASHRWRPQPPVRRREDVAYWLYAGLRYLRQPVQWSPFGVDLVTGGAAMYVDYLLDRCALGVKRNGDQVTIGYDEAERTWVVGAKDRETIDATVYFDDAKMKPDLRRDMAAEVDEVFVTAYLEDGTKILNTVWPGLQQVDPIPDYPVSGGDSFGFGTTDEDTVRGDGVSVMLERLIVLGYLDRDDRAGGFDADVQIAIYEMRADLDLLINEGVADSAPDMEMDPDLWDAMWDLGATGYTTKEARILPLAQRRAIRKWNRSATGNKLDANENYDPDQEAVAVSRTVDMGHVRSKNHARRLGRRMLNDPSEPNWVGTVSTQLAFVAGEHNPGDPVTEADILSNRDIRTGMNVWAPLWQGGCLFHVSGVDVSNGGRDVRLMLDTRARDTMQVDGIVKRNKENRTAPARAFWNARSSRIPKDVIFGHDEHFGILGNDIYAPGGEWTVYAVVAGDYGTVARTAITTYDGNPIDVLPGEPEREAAEFAAFIFGEKVTAAWLNVRVPNPLNSGDRWWANKAQREETEERRLLYAVGSEESPLGYWPGEKALPPLEGEDPEPDPDPITGEWQDDSAFAYRSPGCVLYVAVYPDRDTVIQRGKQLFVQRDEGS